MLTVILIIVFIPAVCNSSATKSTSENEKSADRDTVDKSDSPSMHKQDTHKMCVKLTEELTSSRESATLSVLESTISDVDHLISRMDHVITHTAALNGENMKGKVDGAVDDVTVGAATQAEGNNGEEANTIENKEAIALNNGLQDDSSNNNNELVSKTCTNNEEKTSLLEAITDVTTTKGDTENVILELNKKPVCNRKVLETAVESNIERKRSSTIPAKPLEKNNSYSHPISRKRASTISFKVEATTPIREASLEIEPLEVVVSLCSTSPISELEDDSEDAVIVNPEAEQVLYTLTRKRAKSGIDSVLIKSANSALKRSVKINANVEAADLDHAFGDKNVSPVPRVSTLNRYRNTFSWKRGRSVTRQSFAAKSASNFLSFHNISYTVQQKKLFGVLKTKVILNNVRYVLIINTYISLLPIILMCVYIRVLVA